MIYHTDTVRFNTEGITSLEGITCFTVVSCYAFCIWILCPDVQIVPSRGPTVPHVYDLQPPPLEMPLGLLALLEI
jgi:hypothetical protein